MEITRATGRAKFGARLILDAKPSEAIEALRSRSTPAEAVADEVRAAIADLSAALAIIEAAAKPSALPEVEGKPNFADFIERNIGIFGTERRKDIARILAERSDTTQAPITSKELGEMLGIDVQTVAGSYRHLATELEDIGLKLETVTLRLLNDHAEYQKTPAFRICWNLDAATDKKLRAAAERKAADSASVTAEETRTRVLTALGASLRSTDEDITIEEDKVPALSKIDGKPKFSDLIQQKNRNFNDAKFAIFKKLAEESDSTGKPLSASEIAERVGSTTSAAIATNLRFSKKELSELGLGIQSFHFARKNDAGENITVTCYRLAWAESITEDAKKESIKAPDTTNIETSKIALLRAELAAAQEQIETLKTQSESSRNADKLTIEALKKRIQDLEAEIAKLQATKSTTVTPASTQPTRPQPATTTAAPIKPAPAADVKPVDVNLDLEKNLKKSHMEIVREHPAVFGGTDNTKYIIADTLAEAADDGEEEGFMTRQGIMAISGLNQSQITNFIFASLSSDLERVGLKLIERIKDANTKIYRIEKIAPQENQQPPAHKTVKDIPLETSAKSTPAAIPVAEKSEPAQVEMVDSSFENHIIAKIDKLGGERHIAYRIAKCLAEISEKLTLEDIADLLNINKGLVNLEAMHTVKTHLTQIGINLESEGNPTNYSLTWIDGVAPKVPAIPGAKSTPATAPIPSPKPVPPAPKPQPTATSKPTPVPAATKPPEAKTRPTLSSIVEVNVAIMTEWRPYLKSEGIPVSSVTTVARNLRMVNLSSEALRRNLDSYIERIQSAARKAKGNMITGSHLNQILEGVR